MNNLIIEQFFIPFIVWFFIIFGIISFAIGAGLIINHVRMQKLFGVMNQWVSLRHSTRWLAIPHDTGPSIQRFRYLIGTAIIIAAVFSTFILVTQINGSMLATVLGAESSGLLGVLIIDCIRWFLIVSSVFAIVIGIMLVFSPKALRTIETYANQWYSVRKHSQAGDTMHMSFDDWVKGNPKIVGWITAAGALIVVVNFGILTVRI